MTTGQHAITVPPALRPWISGISVATASTGDGEQTVIDTPDHATTLALRVIPGRSDSVAEQVRTTARLLNLSERHLRDLFGDAVGLTPKLFARLDRVRAVLARPRQHRAHLAAELGYYDQSHMTAEFRRIMGVPPGAFNAGRFPAPSPCHREP